MALTTSVLIFVITQVYLHNNSCLLQQLYFFTYIIINVSLTTINFFFIIYKCNTLSIPTLIFTTENILFGN